SLLALSSGLATLTQATLSASKEEPDAAEERIRKRAGDALVDHTLVGRLQHNLRGWKHRKAGRVGLSLTLTSRQIGIVAGEAARLQILIGVAIERHSLPLAVENRAERDMVGNLAGIAVHRLADIVGWIRVVVGAQVFRVSEPGEDIFAAKLKTCVGHPVAEFGIKHCETGPAEEVT